MTAAAAVALRAQTLGIALAAIALAVAAIPRGRGREDRDDAMAAMQAVVLRVTEDAGTRTIRAPAPITIGRAADATLVVSDAQVSRLHARIDFSDGTLCVRDLDSRNGTWLNARPIAGVAALAVGDEIDVGRSRIVFAGLGPWT